MKIVIEKKENTNIGYDQIVNLMHESFEERLQQGLKFSCSFMSTQEFEQKNSDGIIYVALDEDSGELLGSAVVHIMKDDNGVLYGYNEFLAISPKVKRCGIGSQLQKARQSECQRLGCEYIMSDTAVGATSSIKYHLKNGYKIVGFMSYPMTNYYSYIFRKQLVGNNKWNNSIYCKLMFLLSYLKIRLCLKKNGERTLFYKWYSKCLKK